MELRKGLDSSCGSCGQESHRVHGEITLPPTLKAYQRRSKMKYRMRLASLVKFWSKLKDGPATVIESDDLAIHAFGQLASSPRARQTRHSSWARA